MTSQLETELASAPGPAPETASCRIDRIVAAVESDSNIEQLYSRLSAAEEKSAQLAALNSELQTLASGLQAQAEKLTTENSQLKQQVTELKASIETSAVGSASSPQASVTRKTLSPAMSALLTKSGVDSLEAGRIDAAALDRTLSPLTVEQRIAVKAEMARAGIID